MDVVVLSEVLSCFSLPSDKVPYQNTRKRKQSCSWYIFYIIFPLLFLQINIHYPEVLWKIPSLNHTALRLVLSAEKIKGGKEKKSPAAPVTSAWWLEMQAMSESINWRRLFHRSYFQSSQEQGRMAIKTLLKHFWCCQHPRGGVAQSDRRDAICLQQFTAAVNTMSWKVQDEQQPNLAIKVSCIFPRQKQRRAGNKGGGD